MNKFHIAAVISFLILSSSCTDKSGMSQEKETLPVKQAFTNETRPDSIATLEQLRSYSKIEVVSFSVYDWVRLKNKTFPQKDSFAIPTKERVELNDQQIVTLSRLTSTGKSRTCFDSLQADCYDPRHAIIFYRNDKPSHYLEICFSCGRYKNHTPFWFCSDNFSAYKTFLKEAGITFFPDYEDQ